MNSFTCLLHWFSYQHNILRKCSVRSFKKLLPNQTTYSDRQNQAEYGNSINNGTSGTEVFELTLQYFAGLSFRRFCDDVSFHIHKRSLSKGLDALLTNLVYSIRLRKSLPYLTRKILTRQFHLNLVLLDTCTGKITLLSPKGVNGITDDGQS